MNSYWGDLPEVRCRRDGWTPGFTVRLADMSSWHLPRLDAARFAADDLLLGDLHIVLDLADKVGRDGGPAGALTLAEIRYHSRIAEIGSRLLRANYDLPDDRWGSLWAFDDAAAMFDLTFAISAALAECEPAWAPLLGRGGRGRRPLTADMILVSIRSGRADPPGVAMVGGHFIIDQ